MRLRLFFQFTQNQYCKSHWIVEPVLNYPLQKKNNTLFAGIQTGFLGYDISKDIEYMYYNIIVLHIELLHYNIKVLQIELLQL